MKAIFAVALGAVLGTSSLAAADGKAWKTAKDNLPDAQVAVAVDMDAIKKTALWAKVSPKLTGKADVQQGLALAKSACNIDVYAAVTSLVIALDPANDKGAAYIAVPSLGGRDKILKCVQAVADAQNKAAKDAKDKITLKVTNDGNLTELDTGSVKYYLGFLGDVVVLASSDELRDKAAVKAWVSGAGAFAKGSLGKLLGKASTSAQVFGGSTATKQLASAGNGIKQVYGWANIVSGKLGAEIHADLGDAGAATKLVNESNTNLKQMVANPPLPALKPVLAGITIAASGTEMVLKENAAESDIVALVDLMLAFMH